MASRLLFTLSVFFVLGVSAMLLPEAALAQTSSTPPAPDFGGNVVQLLLSLGAVLAMIVGALWLLKKISQPRGPGSGLLRVVAATAVGARERVVVVEVGSTWLVLGVAPGRVSALAEVPRQTLPPSVVPRTVSADFPDWLRRLTSHGRTPPRVP